MSRIEIIYQTTEMCIRDSSKGVAEPSVEIQFGPNIKDWPAMPKLSENLILKVVSEIHDPVTTPDELIPSGETSSFLSLIHI